MKKYMIQGKEYSLAPVTTKRLTQYMSLLGIKNFDALKNKDALSNISVQTLNIGLDPERIKNALAVCLLEPLDELSVDDLDLTQLDEIMNDFFMQRLVKSNSLTDS